MIEQLAGVAAVLGSLLLLVVVLQKKGIARWNLPALGAGKQRTMEVVERLPLTAQHSLHLVRVGGETLLVGVSPSGCHLLERPRPEEAR